VTCYIPRWYARLLGRQVISLFCRQIAEFIQSTAGGRQTVFITRLLCKADTQFMRTLMTAIKPAWSFGRRSAYAMNEPEIGHSFTAVRSRKAVFHNDNDDSST